MLVSLTLAPALIAIFGNLLFWPGPGWYRKSRRAARAARREAIRADQPPAELPSPWHFRERIARLGTAKPVALIIAAACVLAMLGVGWKATSLRLGAPLISALPGSTQEARAQAAAGQGFAAGILSPTEVLVLGHGAAGQTSALDRLQRSLTRQPGVAGVIGPATVPVAARRLRRCSGPGRPAEPDAGQVGERGPVRRHSAHRSARPHRGAADPGVAAAAAGLTRTAGLTGVRIEVGGETAAAGEAISSTTASIASFAPIMLIVTLVLLVLFLSALIAPLYLLAASILALFATLGVTVWVFQHQLGADGLVYYVPFTVGVLLVSLGADYNVFVVGRIWEEARRRPLRDAIAVAASQASRAITVAGITLAVQLRAAGDDPAAAVP